MKNMYQWIADVISDKQRKVIPIMTNPGIELCKYTVKDAVTDGKVHSEAIIKLNERYPADASTVIMDLTVEAEAFGAEVVFSDDEVPNVTGRLVTDLESVRALHIPDLRAGRIPEYILANRLTAEKIIDKPVLGGCIGPFSLAGRLFGMTELMMALYTEPKTVILLLEKCTAFILSYCEAIKKVGVDGIIIAEPAAGLISNDDCSLYSSKYVRQIVDALQDETFIIILHNCGNTGHCTPTMVETGAAGLHFGNKIDMVKALEDCPENILVMGNIDPVGVFKMESADSVKKITSELLQATAKYENFILSSGCDVPSGIPMENIEGFYDALEEYNKSL